MVVKTLYNMFKQVPIGEMFWAPPELVCGLPRKLKAGIRIRESVITILGSECYLRMPTRSELFKEVFSKVPESERERFLLEIAVLYYMCRIGRQTLPPEFVEAIDSISKDTIDIMEENFISEELLKQLRTADAIIPMVLMNLYGNLVYQLYVEYRDSVKLFTGVRNVGFVRTFPKSFVGGYLESLGFPERRSKTTIPSKYDKPLVFNALFGLTLDTETHLKLANKFNKEFAGDILRELSPMTVVLALNRALNLPQFLDELLSSSLEKLEKGIPFNQDDHIAITKFLEIANLVLEYTHPITYEKNLPSLLDPTFRTETNFVLSRSKLYRGHELPLAELSKIEPPRGFFWTSKTTKGGKIKYRLLSVVSGEPLITSLGKNIYVLIATRVISGYKLSAKDLLEIKEEILSSYYNFENKEV